MSLKDRLIILFTLSAIIILPLVASGRAGAQALPELGGLMSIQPKGPIIRQENMDNLARKLGQGLNRQPTDMETGLVAAAQAELRRTLKREPTPDEVYFLAAQELRARKNTRGFFDFMFAAIRVAPNNWVYRSALGDEFRRTEKKQKAIDSYLAAARVAQSADKAGAAITHKWAADLLRQLGRFPEAERTYERSLAQFSAYAPEIERRMSDDRTRRAWTAARSDAATQLLAVKQKLAKTRPAAQMIAKDLPSVELISTADKGVIEQARARVQRAAPDVRSGLVSGAGAHYLLAADYALIGNDVASVVELLASVELEPKDRQLWRSLGHAYLRQNRLSEAAGALKRACELGDKDSCPLAQKAFDSVSRLKQQPAAGRPVRTRN
ncbi:MAG: hypothetical protein Q7T82_02670 [Armatimonadota bacterium]|nr:hypothetical protein [Armatimonadota bacterium]